MLRRYAPYLATGLGLIAMLAFAFLRPITIRDGERTYTTRSALTAGQALFNAGVRLDAADRVEPPLGVLVLLNGQVQVTRAVQLWVWDEGRLHPASGLKRSAGGLLAAASIRVSAQDRLLWNGEPISPEQPLPTGQPVVLQLIRARSVVLDNGVERMEITSAAASATGMLWDGGVKLGPGDRLSVDPASPVENGAVLAVQPARPLVIQAGEQVLRTATTADTVGQALADAGISLQGLDYAVPAEDQPLPANGQVRVVRVHEEINLKQAPLPYGQKVSADPKLPPEQRVITRAGQPGVKVTRERARFEDQREVGRKVDSDWVAVEPAPELVSVGSSVAISTLDTPNGPIEYWRSVKVYATSYSPCDQKGDGSCSYSTSSGMRLQHGVIAVTHSWYRIIGGLRVYVPGYGTGVIADVGGGIPGKPWIDLGFDASDTSGMFTGWTTMYFLTPAPDNTSWTLP